MRLIDADAINYCSYDLDNYHYFRAVDEDEIAEMPTIDAVPVVRCKDCNQWQRNCGVTDSPNGHCFYLDAEMNGYDFCSYGERRSNNGV